MMLHVFTGLAASLGVGALSEVTKKSLGLTKKEGKDVCLFKFMGLGYQSK